MKRSIVVSFSIFIFLVLWLISPLPTSAAIVCSGSGSSSYTSYECRYNIWAGHYCYINGTDFNSGVCSYNLGTCSFKETVEEHCTATAFGPGAGCIWSNQCDTGDCYNSDGCSTCDDANCASGYTETQSCGSTTVNWSCYASCGNYRSGFYTSSCRECESCSVGNRCGQALDCGGNCSSEDDGAPTVPVCNNLGTVTGMPTTISWSSGGTLADRYDYRIDGGAEVSVPGLSASVTVAAGPHTYDVQSVNTNCAVDSSSFSSACSLCYETKTALNCGLNSRDCSAGVCQFCAPTFSAWSTCDANHKRYRTCVDNDGACNGDDCPPAVLVEDCVGTIQGTLFDASDLSSCPATIGTDPGYAPLRLGSAAFDILGLWPAITAPVSTDANGNYTEQVYASTVNGTYSFDYTSLISSGRVSGVKLQCQGASVSLTTQGQIVTKDTGFWRVYSGWWQAVGGSVYARSGLKSYVPASVSPAANQKLILANAGGRVGVLSHGFVWQGTELGTNPNAGVSSALWRIQSLYEGLRYDFNFYKTRMDVFPFTAWDGGVISYDDGGRGYQIFKHTGDVTLNYSGPTGTQKVILLVDGNVTVSGNVTVPSGAFLGVIAKNSIIFNSNLTTAQGWFVAESISAPCSDTVAPLGTCDKTDSQLDGQGSFVGWTGINLSRDMGVGNNTTPAEKFTYRVDMALNAPTPIKVFAKKFSPFIP